MTKTEVTLQHAYHENYGEYPNTKEEVIKIVKKEGFDSDEMDYLDDLIYIHYSTYEANPLALKKEDGMFYTPRSFQLRLFGKNGKDDRGYKDDIQNFKP